MPVDDVFSATSGAATSSSGTLVLTVPRAVAAGKKIVLAADRSDQAYPVGLASITDTRGNTWTLGDAISLRANIVQVSWSHCDVTTALKAGDQITVTWNTVASARKNLVAYVCSGLTAGGPNANSGASVTAGTSGGPNGSSSTPSGSLTTTAASCLLFGAFAAGSGAGPLTPGSGFTAGTSAVTSAGTNDRGLWTEYRTTTTAGAKTVNGTFSSSATWAEAAVAFAVSTATGPIVNAGPDQSVEAGQPFTLTFSATDTSGTVAFYTCTQTAGPTIALSGSGATRTGTAGHVAAGSSYTFSVTATDNNGATSTADTVVVTQLPVPERILIAGVWQSARWSITTDATGGDTGGTDGLTLTVTPDPDFRPPRVRIDVQDLRSSPAGSVTITRRNGDGTTAPVRTSDGGPLPLDHGQGTVYDYEPFYEQTLTYWTDADTTVTAATQLDVHDVWLVHTGVPSRSQIVKLTSLPEEARATARTLYTVLSRKDPVPVTSGARQTPTATMGLRTKGGQQRRALDLLLEDDSVLLLNIPPSKPYGWDACYISAGDLTRTRTVAHGPSQVREWALPIQVVGRPGGGTQAAITWSDVTNLYPTWQAIIDAGVRTWAELAAPDSGP